MSFFGAHPADEPEEHRAPYRRMPSSFGPSPDEVGRPIADSFVLARSPRAAIVVQAIRAFETGCVIEITMIVRRADEDTARWQELQSLNRFRHRDETGLRIGVALADGTTATSVDRFDRRDPGPGPRLEHFGGNSMGGGSERVHGTLAFWLWPLPPAPSMELYGAWTDVGLAESVHTVDTSAVRDAAAHSRLVWPEDAELPEAEI